MQFAVVVTSLAGLLFLVHLGRSHDFANLAFLIISQKASHNAGAARSLQTRIRDQTENLSEVYLSHEEFQQAGDWTVLPLLSKLENLTAEWLFIGTEDTRVDVVELLLTLQGFQPSQAFIGRPLVDQEPTIIHHFHSDPNFKYPFFAAGFVLSRDLVRSLGEAATKEMSSRTDFSIDASYELATFILDGGNGPQLVPSEKFCLTAGSGCATHVTHRHLCHKSPEKKMSSVFFAVKTCKQFHKDRVPVVQQTWGQRTRQMAFFSEAADDAIPTVRLNVRNTQHGHCAKTRAILQDMKKRMNSDRRLQWVVVTDDDTILSVARVEALLNCYNPSEPLAIGERYGYNLLSDKGYNYLTGGGGVALSRGAINKYAKAANCECPSDSTPDDMFLFGVCLQRLNITLVHVPLFHQARPNDYSPDYLSIGEPVSFHKHWMVDPIQVYKTWFEDEDTQLKASQHVEL